MKTTFTFWAPALLAGLAAFSAPTANAQKSLPETVGLENFSQTRAKSFKEYEGRLVLLEFFAYW